MIIASLRSGDQLESIDGVPKIGRCITLADVDRLVDQMQIDRLSKQIMDVTTA